MPLCPRRHPPGSPTAPAWGPESASPVAWSTAPTGPPGHPSRPGHQRHCWMHRPVRRSSWRSTSPWTPRRASRVRRSSQVWPSSPAAPDRSPRPGRPPTGPQRTVHRRCRRLLRTRSSAPAPGAQATGFRRRVRRTPAVYRPLHGSRTVGAARRKRRYRSRSPPAPISAPRMAPTAPYPERYVPEQPVAARLPRAVTPRGVAGRSCCRSLTLRSDVTPSVDRLYAPARTAGRSMVRPGGPDGRQVDGRDP